MAVSLDSLKPGRVFSFKNGDRRITALSEMRGNGFQVYWEYADGQPRNGKRSGNQWSTYFRKDAQGEIPTDSGSETRTLITGVIVAADATETTEVLIQTRCPAKYAVVDLETGDVWRHNGTSFVREEPAEIKTMVAALTALQSGRAVAQMQSTSGGDDE